jgi:hypothetical protein
MNWTPTIDFGDQHTADYMTFFWCKIYSFIILGKILFNYYCEFLIYWSKI